MEGNQGYVSGGAIYESYVRQRGASNPCMGDSCDRRPA